MISEKVDIWALGVILFKLAFFQTPFEDNKGNVDAGAILKGLGDRKVGDASREERVVARAVGVVCCVCGGRERRRDAGVVMVGDVVGRVSCACCRVLVVGTFERFTVLTLVCCRRVSRRVRACLPACSGSQVCSLYL